ncbi:hypothetical protein QPX37_09875 [Corynebacterium accolens]|uniref:hypothetical protein n=1 Tax=Corynebacterium accolens TaxID=38284 RepID=UPI0025436F52|nr:hypothetical protein [Corynebacterium accolens]MDK4276473.1 hypothetical protein [Corynebacterium accolens]MDK4331350.1 hypothetical protein [Corynebacterium accolens]
MSVSDTTENANFDDPRVPLQRAVKKGATALGIFTIISLAVWGGAQGVAGLWGVIVGAALGGGFVLFTALSVLFTANSTPSTTIAVVLGGWLIKLIVLIGVLAIIRDMDFYDTWALFLTVVVALIVTLGSEIWAVVTSRVTYVS